MINKLQKSFTAAIGSIFYKSKFDSIDSPKSMEDFEKLAYTTKAELRSLESPYDLLAIDESNIVQVNTTSGTTGSPTFSLYSSEDLKNGSREVAKAWQAFGITEKSRVQFIMSYGLFSGASHNTLALQSLGAFVIPVGIQSLTRELRFIEQFKPDTLVGTPSFFMHLFTTLREQGNLAILNNWSVKRVIAAGEIYSNEYREMLERYLKVKVHDHYGICEIYSGFAYECDCRSGLHVVDGLVYPEIIDPESGVLLADGEVGELVLTSLHKEATPIIRYRTGDITRRYLSNVACTCEQQHKTKYMIDRIHRRVDDLIFVRGLKFDPHQLRDLILKKFGEHIHSDIQFETSKELDFERPHVYVSLRSGESVDHLELIRITLQDETLIQFTISHVTLEYFMRNSENKVKIVTLR